MLLARVLPFVRANFIRSDGACRHDQYFKLGASGAG